MKPEAPKFEIEDDVPLLQDDDWRSVLRRRGLSCLVTQILRYGEMPLPGELAFVGYSAGAYLAMGWCLDISNAVACATMGGAGMAEAARQAPTDRITRRGYLCLANSDDPLKGNANLFQNYARTLGAIARHEERPGGHPFADYRANGFVKDAFAFCLGHLLEHPDPDL